MLRLKNYSVKDVLENISVDFEQGKVYVVMGSNGDATSNNVTNNMNWIRGNAANVQYNTSGGYHAWEISGAEKMQLTSDGYLTNVAQAGFAARMTANLSHPGNNSFNSGNAWVMPFDDEIWDVGGNFNVSNYTFTAPVTGRYYLSCLLYGYTLDQDASYYFILIQTSNRNYYKYLGGGQWDSDAIYYGIDVQMLCDMDANDTASISFGQSGGHSSSQILASASFFSGYLAC